MARIKTKKVRADLENKLKAARLAAPKHGIKHPEKIKAVGNVICRGVKKPIYLIGNSFVMVAGHKTDIELAFHDLGGRMCRCLEALREFKAGRSSDLPPLFATAANVLWRKRARRRLLRQIYTGRYHGDDKLKSPAVLLTHRKAKLLLRLKCNYQITSDPRCVMDIRDTHGMCVAYGGRVWSSAHADTPPMVSLLLKLSPAWRKTILPAKLAVVDGRFIANILKEEEGRQVACDAQEAKAAISNAMYTGEPIDVQVLDEYEYLTHGKHQRSAPIKRAELQMRLRPVKLVFVDQFGNKKPKLLIDGGGIWH